MSDLSNDDIDSIVLSLYRIAMAEEKMVDLYKEWCRRQYELMDNESALHALARARAVQDGAK